MSRKSTHDLKREKGFNEALRLFCDPARSQPIGMVEASQHQYLMVDISSGTAEERQKADLTLRGKSYKMYRIANSKEEGAMLGHGSFGVVMRAETKEGLQMAVKIQTVEMEDAKNLQNETKMSRLAGMKCYDCAMPSVARNEDGIQVHGVQHYLVMPEYRKSLFHHLNDRPSYGASAALDRTKFDMNARLELAIDLFSAVHNLHQKGIVHRDVKPENMFIDASGRVQLADFGSSKQDLQADIEEVGATKSYLPTERVLPKGWDKDHSVFYWSEPGAAKLGDRVGALRIVCPTSEMFDENTRRAARGKGTHTLRKEHYPAIFDQDALSALPNPLKKILNTDERSESSVRRINSWQNPHYQRYDTSDKNSEAKKTSTESELFFAAVFVLYKNFYNAGNVPDDAALTTLIDELRTQPEKQQALVDEHFHAISEYDLADCETLTTRERPLEEQENARFIEQVQSSLREYHLMTTRASGLSGVFHIRNDDDKQLVAQLQSLLGIEGLDTQPEISQHCVDNMRLVISQSFSTAPRETVLKSCFTKHAVLPTKPSASTATSDDKPTPTSRSRH